MKTHHTPMSQTFNRKRRASVFQKSQNEVESAAFGNVGIDEGCPVLASTLDVATSNPVAVSTERKPVDAVAVDDAIMQPEPAAADAITTEAVKTVAVDDTGMETVSMHTTTVVNATHDIAATTNNAKSVAVLGQEHEIDTAIKALEKSMHAPLIQLFQAAECVVYVNELEGWFSSDGFTTLSPEKMEDIAACLSTLARLRRVAQAVK